MPRYPSPYASSFSFGPGPALDRAEGAHRRERRDVPRACSFVPIADHRRARAACRDSSCTRLWLWQLGTYMFLHGGLFHILFNMLALWMFGAELERIWGTRYFLKFYFVTGIGAGILTVLFSLLPFDVRAAVCIVERHRRVGRDLRAAARLRDCTFPIGRSTCICVFPIPAKIFVMIMGAIAFYASLSGRWAASRTRRTSAACSSAYLLPQERPGCIRSPS